MYQMVLIPPSYKLTEVLYSPEVGYTLVSVGRLDENGFSANFSGGKCTITGPDGEQVREIPKNHHGLYHVDHEPESASTAEEVLTLDQTAPPPWAHIPRCSEKAYPEWFYHWAMSQVHSDRQRIFL